VLVQVAAGIAGVAAAHVMFELPLVELSATSRAGPAQWFSEVVATFGLVGTILATLAARPAAVAQMVGLYIGAAYWFTASTSFANPAVTVARTLTDTFSGIDPRHAAPFVAAQLVGASLAVPFFGWLLGPAEERKLCSPAARGSVRD
jgi:glycerol uptake facilitator-like aquaporin